MQVSSVKEIVTREEVSAQIQKDLSRFSNLQHKIDYLTNIHLDGAIYFNCEDSFLLTEDEEDFVQAKIIEVINQVQNICLDWIDYHQIVDAKEEKEVEDYLKRFIVTKNFNAYFCTRLEPNFITMLHMSAQSILKRAVKDALKEIITFQEENYPKLYMIR
jgi:hypothetical protein